MKTVRPALIAIAFVLTGCASSGSTTETSSGATWWNPLTYSWSSLAPWNWFGGDITVTEKGVGGLNGTTPMQEEAINAALNGDYQIRKGMRSENGAVVTFFQAVKDKQVKLTISGDSTVNQVIVSDSDIATGKASIGTPFSDLYSKAFGACQKGTGGEQDGVECKAPDSTHISYVFNGEWHGPEGLLPSDEVLKKWTVSKIIWRR